MTKNTEPLHDIDSERFVLGAMFKSLSAAGQVFERVTVPKFFAKEEHRTIYRAIEESWKATGRIDVVAVSEKLLSFGALEAVGGRNYLLECIEHVGSTAQIDSALTSVTNKFILRRLVEVTDETGRVAAHGKTDAEGLLLSTEKELFEISRITVKNEPTKVSDIVQQIQRDIDHHQTNKKPRAGVQTGFTDVDAVVQAMRPSDLIIVAARPGMGKSAYAMAMAINMAKSGAGVGFFSLEMSKEQLGGRMISDLGSIPSDRLNSFNLTDQEWTAFLDAQGEIDKLPIWIDDTASISTMQLRAKIQRLKMRHNASVFIIDYLQLMTTRKKTENKQQEIADISAQLKAIAKDTGSVIIACSQLSRLVESRPDKMPQLSDLRESGAIEQDADMVLMLYRPEYYAKEGEVKEHERNLCHVRIAKNRHGATGNAKLNFFGEYSRFTNRTNSIISASGTHYDI